MKLIKQLSYDITGALCQGGEGAEKWDFGQKYKENIALTKQLQRYLYFRIKPEHDLIFTVPFFSK